MAGKSAIEWTAFLIFPPVSVGLGRAAGDAFFGLIGFWCETRAARARAAPDASRHTCAQTTVGECMLSVRGVGQATLQPLARVGSQRARAWVVRRSGSETRSRVNRVLLSAAHLTCPTGQRSW